MTYTELKAKPGDLIFSDSGLAVGRINVDLTEDNRWTADGKCSIANGFIKASGISPTDARRFHKAVETNPNGYVLKGYTICLQLKELPVEMWAVKAAEILDGEFDDFQEMLKELSKQPEVEREAKLSVLMRFFKKELSSTNKPKGMTPAAKERIDYFIQQEIEYLDDDGILTFFNKNRSVVFELISLDVSLDEIPMSYVFGVENILWRITRKEYGYKYFNNELEKLDHPVWNNRNEIIMEQYQNKLNEMYEDRILFCYYLIKKKEDKKFSKFDLPRFSLDVKYELGEYREPAEALLKNLLSSKKPIDKQFDVRSKYFDYTMGQFSSSNSFVVLPDMIIRGEYNRSERIEHLKKMYKSHTS